MRTRGGLRASSSPSPQPSPLGRGSIIASLAASRGPLDLSNNGRCGSLSLGERVRVRGNKPHDYPPRLRTANEPIEP